MAKRDAGTPGQDLSQIRTPIHISGKPVEQVINSIHYGSPELRCLLMDECNLIFECKVCRALFRDLPNFISHKRAYCAKSFLEDRHVTIAQLPEEKVVVVQPQAPEETEKDLSQLLQSPSQRPNLEETIQRIQSGELGRSHAYKVYTEAAEKLQRQKEGMKVATIRTTAIPTNKNAVFIDVNMASVNIHERQTQINGGGDTSLDTGLLHMPGPVVAARKAGERSAVGNSSYPTRNTRKSMKQTKHTSEPQKLLMDQLKEIQHKVKQKAIAQDKVTPPKGKSKSSPKTNNSALNSSADQRKDRHRSSERNTDQKKSSGGNLKDLARQNLKSLLTKAEIKDKANSSSKNVKRKDVQSNLKGKSNTAHSKAAKQKIASTISAITAVKNKKKFVTKTPICSKCNSIFATRKSLSFHKKIHHSAKRTFYPCPFCDSVFYYFFGITRHLSRNHNKTSKEIDEMRDQLRSKSYTKPVPPVRSTKIMTEGKATRRTARPLKSSHGDSSEADVKKSPGSNRQVSNTVNKVNEGLSQLAHNILTEDKKTLKSSKSQISIAKPAGIENKKVEVIQQSSTPESRSERLKNRLQQKALEDRLATDIQVDVSNSECPSDASVCALSPTPSTCVSEDSHETPSHICIKCQRSFGRKISYDNHIKVCQGTHHAAIKSETFKEALKTLTPDVLSNNAGSIGGLQRVTRRGRESSDDVIIKPNDEVLETTGVVSNRHILSNSAKLEISSLTTRSKVQVEPSEGEKSENNKNTAIRAGRSASAERYSQQGRSRNRSLERIGLKEKRDSSVESTQSHAEGKSARSRRAAFSKYAREPTPSPQTSLQDTLSLNSVNADEDTDTGNKRISSSQMKTRGKKGDGESNSAQLEGGSNLRSSESKGERQTSPSLKQAREPKLRVAKLKTLKTKTGSYKIAIMKNVDHEKHPPMEHAVDGSGKTRSNRLPGRILPTSSSRSPQKYSFSFHRVSSPRRSVSSSPSPRRADAQQNRPSRSAAPNSSKSKSPSKTLRSPKVENQTAEPKSQEKVKSEGVTKKLDKDLESRDVKSAQILESVNLSQKIQVAVKKEKSEPRTTDERAKPIEGKDLQENVTKEPKCEQNPSETSRPRIAVVSALSDRPKRKRKIPSRNMDAEEMLSKIHNHARDNIPVKKAKTEVRAKNVTEHRATKDMSGTPSSIQGGTKTKADSNTSEKDDLESDEAMEDNDGDGFDDDDEDEEPSKGKGRVVLNRIYVLGKSNSKGKKLKCYDQTRVYRLIDEEKLLCLECGEQCSQASNLRRHVIRTHLKWSRYKCKLCKFESYDRSECTTHILRSHKNTPAYRKARSTNSLIIDLAKQGSHARSLKKTQTLKVKQQSESNAGNIYARPTVKRLPRLSHRSTTEAEIKSDRDVHVSSEEESTNAKQKFSTSMQSSPKSGTTSSAEGKDTTAKGTASKSRPFNISTRNSPRTFDTSPYTGKDTNSESADRIQDKPKFCTPRKLFISTDGKSHLPGNDSLTLTLSKQEMKNSKQEKECVELSPNLGSGMTAGYSAIKEDLQKSRNIFDKMKDGSSISDTGILEVTPDVMSSVFIKNCPGFYDKRRPRRKIPEEEQCDQDSEKNDSVEKDSEIIKTKASAPASVPQTIISKSNAPPRASRSFVVGSSQQTNISTQKTPRSPEKPKQRSSTSQIDNSTSNEELAKSLMKLKKLSDQVQVSSCNSSINLSSQVTHAVSVVKTISAQDSQVSSKQLMVLSPSSALKTTNTDSISTGRSMAVVQSKSNCNVTASQETSLAFDSGSSGSTVVTKTVTGPAIVLSQGQSGKVILFTRPSDDKEHPTRSNAPSSSTLPKTVKTQGPISSTTTSSSTPSTAAPGKDVVPSGKFIVHQHYI